MSGKSVAVLGTVCCDKIIRLNEDPKTGLGGIFYNLITLAQLLDKDDEIIPVCRIGSINYDEILTEFRKYPNINTGYISKYTGKNNTVVLKYFSQNERTEYSTNLPEPYKIKDLIPFPDADVLLINFVSGIEMNYNTFRSLKKKLKIPVYVDLHSIFLGFRAKGERFYKKAGIWDHWKNSGDILQMNEQEARILSGRHLKDKNEFVEFGKTLLAKGVETALITLGSKGVIICWRTGSRMFHKSISAFTTGDIKDPTGCGDVFSASFVKAFLNGAGPYESAEFANKVSGVRATQYSSSELHRLKNILIEKSIPFP
ncbi:carbohydrate kinase family protein [candidate division KSB1 bacterium]